MEMQDNEFDDLFRSKLDGFEVEPSANVWPGIAIELAGQKRRRILIPVLSIAASIIVLVTAGILFIPKKTLVGPKHHVQNTLAKTPWPVNPVGPAKGDTQAGGLKPVNGGAGRPVHSNTLARLQPARTTGYDTVKSAVPQIDSQQPVKMDEQPMIAATAKPQPDKLDNIVPVGKIQPAIKPTDDDAVAFTTKPVLAAGQAAPVNKPDAAPVKTRHKIHSLGDLINVVVAKVDKRKDKIIQFTDTDDGDSNITGVNLGVIKIKKGE